MGGDGIERPLQHPFVPTVGTVPLLMMSKWVVRSPILYASALNPGSGMVVRVKGVDKHGVAEALLVSTDLPSPHFMNLLCKGLINRLTHV